MPLLLVVGLTGSRVSIVQCSHTAMHVHLGKLFQTIFLHTHSSSPDIRKAAHRPVAIIDNTHGPHPLPHSLTTLQRDASFGPVESTPAPSTASSRSRHPLQPPHNPLQPSPEHHSNARLAHSLAATVMSHLRQPNLQLQASAVDTAALNGHTTDSGDRVVLATPESPPVIPAP